MALPYIRAEDVEHKLDWLRMADALEAGHRAAKPVISDQVLARGADILLSRAAWIDGLGAAVKSVTVLPGNPAKGLASVNGAMLLFDDASGAVEAVIDSALVTKWKTAADSLLGARFLARKDSSRLLIAGAGVVARSLIDAYRALFPGIAVSVWNRGADKARLLAAETGAEFASDLETAVRHADIVATATMTQAPIIRGDWLQPGAHLDLIGAFTPDMREADDAAIRRSRLFVDCRDTTLDHIGELLIPLRNGVIGREQVLGDLRDLANGAPGRLSSSDITLFKNGGGAHLDLMVGKVILAALKGQVMAETGATKQAATPHRSRLGCIVIDCKAADVRAAAEFWGAALGGAVEFDAEMKYAEISDQGEIKVLVQAVDHDPRVHMDIESDDKEAEVARLQALGATIVARVKGWIVMQAPTGHRFCVVNPQSEVFAQKARQWL